MLSSIESDLSALGNNKQMHYWYWLLPLGLFFATMLPLLLMHGMPDPDGLVYASISRNLSLGLGSFWRPYYSQFHLNKFYEHPALAISWLAWLYKLFGDHAYVEKTYSMLVTLVTWFLEYALLKCFIPELRWYHAWVMLSCWFLVVANPWYYSSNMLEPVATIFSLMALIAIIISYQSNAWGWRLFAWMILAGAATCIGVLVNGPLVLYVWLVEPCLGLAYRQKSMKYHACRWGLLLFFTALVFAVCVPAHHNFFMYLKHQVLATLFNQRSGCHLFGFNRLSIVCVALYFFTPVILVFGVCCIYAPIDFSFKVRRNVMFFLLLFCVSLFPVMLSSKQFPHYSLQSYPFLIMGSLILAVPIIFKWLEQVYSVTHVSFRMKLLLTAFFITCSTCLVIFMCFQVQLLGIPYVEAEAIIKQVGHNAVVSRLDVGRRNPVLIETYLQRFGGVSLKAEDKPSTPYLIDVYPTRDGKGSRLGYHLLPQFSKFRYARLYREN